MPPAPPPRRDDGLHALAKAHAEIRSVQIEADRLRVQIKGRDAHIAELKISLASRVDEFDRLRAELQAKDTELTAKSAELQAKDTELTAKSAELQAKDTELTAKSAELQALREQLKQAAPVILGDDLKRVRGIGPGFERILKDNGVTTYAQMAAWTGDDILRFAALLNTQPGRIARGGWIEQATALIASDTANSATPNNTRTT